MYNSTFATTNWTYATTNWTYATTNWTNGTWDYPYTEWLIASTPLVAINVLIFIPFVVWCIYQVRIHWYDRFFSKRRPMLVIAYLVTLTLYHVGDVVVYYAYLIDYTSWELTRIYYILYSCVWWPLISMTENILLIRIWLLYFDNNLYHLLKNSHWQLTLNPNIDQRTFFLKPKNQRRWGSYSNGSLLLQISIIVLLIDSGFFIFVYLYKKWYTDTVYIEIGGVGIKVKYVCSKKKVWPSKYPCTDVVASNSCIARVE